MLPKKSHVICSTPRSGSNLLNSYIRELKIVGPTTEWLNCRHMANHSGDKLGFDEEYYKNNRGEVLQKIVENNLCPLGTFSAKIHYYDFLDFVKVGINPFAIMANPRFVHIKRKDVIAQAVSFEKAMQQKAWTCFEKPSQNIQYNFKEILERLKQVISANQGWEHLFTSIKYKPLIVIYEELEKNPKEIVTNVMKFFGYDLNKEQIEGIHTPLKRQSDSINDDWRKRFEADLKANNIKVG